MTYPEESKSTIATENTAHALLAVNQEQPNNSSKPIILVVEDNPDIRNLIAEILSVDYSVFLAEDGIQGIKMASEIMPDLIITDLMMPGKNGYELCEVIKNDKLTSHIYIIMLTVRASDDSIKEGLIKGADYYLTKPFNGELLKLHIANILKRRQDMALYFRGENEYFIPDNLTQEEAIELEHYDGDQGIQLSEIDQEFLKNLNEIIDKNLGNSDFSVVDLTHHLGFSKSQLYRKLKAIIGMSANAYIRAKRLQKATELITTNNFTIAEVTYKVGFNDLQYFRSCFKNAYGVNPSDYAGEEPLTNAE
jgi:DNA-binding response OmpR family regulator